MCVHVSVCLVCVCVWCVCVMCVVCVYVSIRFLNDFGWKILDKCNELNEVHTVKRLHNLLVKSSPLMQRNFRLSGSLRKTGWPGTARGWAASSCMSVSTQGGRTVPNLYTYCIIHHTCQGWSNLLYTGELTHTWNNELYQIIHEWNSDWSLEYSVLYLQFELTSFFLDWEYNL